jgi:hypothetical protein
MSDRFFKEESVEYNMPPVMNKETRKDHDMSPGWAWKHTRIFDQFVLKNIPGHRRGNSKRPANHVWPAPWSC